MKTACSVLLALVAIATLLSAASHAEASRAPVRLAIFGLVTDEEPHRPVRGARVVLTSDRVYETTTDSAGMYAIDSLPYRDHVVEVFGLGRIPERREVWVGCVPAVLSADGKAVLQPEWCTDATERLDFRLRFRPRHR